MLICGIDEAGRGPLAGPVVVAGTVFEDTDFIAGVKDSKALSEKKREELFDIIISKAADFCIEVIGVDVIDKTNILQATMTGMRNCITKLSRGRNLKVFIDGNYFRFDDGFEKTINFETVVKGDSKIFSISAASILAKVTRDRIMYEYDSVYPEYKFGSNKGYPTKEHIAAIINSGTCKIHREKFCRKFCNYEITF
ncbi:MAG TPA: ribonuclease HII [Ignavibacteria bacterium]|nr:ribonuclease HII [Ignavibacteria bacterium]